MIYHIIVFEDESGKCLLNIHISPPVVREVKINILTAFFSALDKFSLGMFESNQEVMNYISFFKYSVRFIKIQEIKSDILIVYDQNEKYDITNFSHYIVGKLKRFKDLFDTVRESCNTALLSPVITPVLKHIIKVNEEISEIDEDIKDLL